MKKYLGYLAIIALCGTVFAKTRAPEVYEIDEGDTSDVIVMTPSTVKPRLSGLPSAAKDFSPQNRAVVPKKEMGVWGSPTTVPVYPAPSVPYAQSEQLSSLPAYRSTLPPGQFEADFWVKPRALYVYNVHTKESATVTYWKDGNLIPSGYWELCRLMRDHREGLMAAMDPKLLDMLYGIQGYYHAWKYFKPIEILSGYRTPKTNKLLESEGAGRNSQHMNGTAVDIRIQGISQQNIGNLAMYFKQGGVGFYYSSNFTHIDTGPVRTWVR